MLDCGLPLVSKSITERKCRRVLRIGDAAAVSAAFILAPFLLPSSDFRVALEVDPVTSFGSLGIAIFCVLAVLEIGQSDGDYSKFERIQQICLALGAVFMLEAFLSYVGFAWLLGLMETFMGSLVCAALLMLWFLVFRQMFPGFPGSQRVLLLGSDAAFSEIGGALAVAGGGYEVLGPLPFPRDLGSMANELAPDEIVVGEVAATGAFPANALLDLRFHGVGIVDAAAFFESTLQRVSCRHLEPVRFLYGDMAPKRQNLALQAIYSNFLGLTALVIASPVLLCAAIALKISAPNEPLLEPYRAVGLHGIPFDRLRFQSKSRLGRWFARVRVRGLPQLFNVVRGEMSLVGPRPCRMEFRDALSQQFPYYSQRVAVRPGLTGWAQIRGAKLGKTTGAAFDASVEMEYDLYYIKHVSPSFDLDILLAAILGRTAD
jgi:lipopolysaccharide/colanic/teichoic acid biosynthesis glycosyltransferase